MSDVTLTMAISVESKLRTKPRMISVGFGDGYTQQAPDGINATPDEWQIVTPPSTTATIDAIVSSLESAAAAGVRLLWTPPGGSAQKWLVPESWERTFHSYNVESLSFTLKEAFG